MMRHGIWLGLMAALILAAGCGKKKPAASCDQLWKMRGKCVVGHAPIKGNREQRVLRTCKMAKELIPLVQRQVACTVETDCGKYKACFKDNEVSKATWKLLFKFEKATTRDTASKISPYLYRFRMCVEWKEDKLGVLKHLCKKPMAERWATLIPETEKQIKGFWKDSSTVTISKWKLINLGELLGRDKDAKFLASAIGSLNMIYKAKHVLDKRLAYYKKHGEGIRIPSECNIDQFEQYYLKSKHPEIQKIAQRLMSYCFVTAGAAVLEMKMKKNANPCYTRGQVMEGMKRFKLKDAKIEATLSQIASKCK